jgi:Tfp pilus assembly protein PilF
MSDFLIKQAFAEAMDLQKNNQLDKAKEIYRKILKVDESEPNAHHLISLIFMAEGNFSEAKKHIEIAIDKAPDQAVFLSNYGSLLHTMGDNQAAIKNIKKSLKADKKLLQSYYSLGIIYTDLNEVDKAIENYNKALEIDNNSSAVHNNLANIFSNTNNPEAEYHYKKLIELVPQEIYPRLNMSNYLIKNSKFKDALIHLNELLDMGLESKEVFNSLGVTYKGLDDDEKAKEMFNKALKLDPNFDLAKKNIDSLN